MSYSDVKYTLNDTVTDIRNNSRLKWLPFLITIMVVKCYSHVIIPLNEIELDRNSILQYYLLCWCLWKIWNAVKNDDEEDEDTRLNIYTRLNVLTYTCIYCKTICPFLFLFVFEISMQLQFCLQLKCTTCK